MLSEARESREVLASTIEAQQQSIARLTDALEKQAEMIAGLTVALGAVIDVLATEEMREVLRSHLSLSIAQQAPDVARSLLETIID